MNAYTKAGSEPHGSQGLSSEARNLHWLLTNLVEEVPGVHSVAVVSSDGLLLLSSDPGMGVLPGDAAGNGGGGGTTAAPTTAAAPRAPAPTSPPSSPASGR